MKRTLGLLFLIACAGTVGAQTFLHVESQFDEVAGVDGLDFAWSVATSPDGKHVYVCSGVANVACELDPVPIGINRPREMALGSRGAFLYVAGKGNP